MIQNPRRNPSPPQVPGLCFEKDRAHAALAAAAPVLFRLQHVHSLDAILRSAEGALTTRRPYYRRVTDAQWITTQGPDNLARCLRDIEALARIVGTAGHEPEPAGDVTPESGEVWPGVVASEARVSSWTPPGQTVIDFLAAVKRRAGK